MLLLLAIASLSLEDIPASLRSDLPPDWTAYSNEVAASSARRLREGEMDHLVYYVLQSAKFTSLAPIEPARSAREFIEKHAVPPAVTERVDAFLQRSRGDKRFLYLRSLTNTRAEILREYERAMRFLYDKEYASLSKQGDARRRHVAQLYETRGHSSDTSPDAAYSMREALTALRGRAPEFVVRRALVVGPGLDFAPRTGLREESEPQSYQPLALYDSLRTLKLGPHASVECVDLNPRVVEYFEQRAQPSIAATRMNILTHRLDGPKFDLIVATNILLYFDVKELLRAMASMRAMLAPNGVLLHNDIRGEVERYGGALGMPVMDARVIRLSSERQLYDTIVMHRTAK